MWAVFFWQTKHTHTHAQCLRLEFYLTLIANFIVPFEFRSKQLYTPCSVPNYLRCICLKYLSLEFSIWCGQVFKLFKHWLLAVVVQHGKLFASIKNGPPKPNKPITTINQYSNEPADGKREQREEKTLTHSQYYNNNNTRSVWTGIYSSWYIQCDSFFSSLEPMESN